MDLAFIEHAENDIDSYYGRKNQDRLIGERVLEGLRSALKSGLNAGRHIEFTPRPFDRSDGAAERRAWSQVERKRNYGELSLVIDRERARTEIHAREAA